MNWLTGLVVYFLIWWLVIFMTLSWGLRRSDDARVKGVPDAVPENIRLGRKALVTTLISAVIWLGIYAVVKSDLISFRQMAEEEVRGEK